MFGIDDGNSSFTDNLDFGDDAQAGEQATADPGLMSSSGHGDSNGNPRTDSFWNFGSDPQPGDPNFYEHASNLQPQLFANIDIDDIDMSSFETIVPSSDLSLQPMDRFQFDTTRMLLDPVGLPNRSLLGGQQPTALPHVAPLQPLQAKSNLLE